MIGLLQCDHVRPEFVSISGDYDAMFQRWLPDDWRIYDVAAGQRPATPTECDAYITTGSRSSVYDDEPWIHAFSNLVHEIHQASVPCLGVCFGHQMIAHALGGRVSKSPRGWGIGVHHFQVTRHEPWMQPPLDTFAVLMSCQDQVDELPNGATVLAGNEHCPIGMFRLGNMLGLQGHPEFTTAYAEALMRFRTPIIGQETVDKARQTLTQPTHSEELSAWAQNFLLSR